MDSQEMEVPGPPLPPLNPQPCAFSRHRASSAAITLQRQRASRILGLCASLPSSCNEDYVSYRENRTAPFKTCPQSPSPWQDPVLSSHSPFLWSPAQNLPEVLPDDNGLCTLGPTKGFSTRWPLSDGDVTGWMAESQDKWDEVMQVSLFLCKEWGAVGSRTPCKPRLVKLDVSLWVGRREQEQWEKGIVRKKSVHPLLWMGHLAGPYSWESPSTWLVHLGLLHLTSMTWHGWGQVHGSPFTPFWPCNWPLLGGWELLRMEQAPSMWNVPVSIQVQPNQLSAPADRVFPSLRDCPSCSQENQSHRLRAPSGLTLGFVPEASSPCWLSYLSKTHGTSVETPFLKITACVPHGRSLPSSPSGQVPLWKCWAPLRHLWASDSIRAPVPSAGKTWLCTSLMDRVLHGGGTWTPVSQLPEEMFAGPLPCAGARHHLALSSTERTLPSSLRWPVKVRGSPTHVLPRARNSPPIRGATKSWICWKKWMCGMRQMEPLPRQGRVTNRPSPRGVESLFPGSPPSVSPSCAVWLLSPWGSSPPVTHSPGPGAGAT